MKNAIFTDVQTISMQGDGPVNEDLYFCDGNRAWVLDGVPALEGPLVTGWDSDARWLVNRLDAALKVRLPGPRKGVKKQQIEDRLADVLAVFIEQFQKKFNGLKEPGAWNNDEILCAFGALVCSRKGMLEYLVFGDSVLLLRFRDGQVKALSELELQKLNDQVIARGQQVAQRSGLPLSQCLQGLLPFLKYNRTKMNSLGNYYGICNVPSAPYCTIWSSVPVSDLDAVCLLTGGFAQHYALFGLSKGPEGFMNAVEQSGLAALGAELRAAQLADSQLLQYPRFRCCDDATAVFFRIRTEE